METIVLILIIGLLNIFCFVVGTKVGQQVTHNETINVPNPVKIVKEYKDSKEYKESQENLNAMLDNINNYDGSGMGQREIY